MNDDVISVIFLFGILPLIVVVGLVLVQKLKHKERLTLLEKGVDISLIPKRESPFNDVLMWGILAFGIGLGLLLGYLMLESHLLEDDMILGISAIIFGGIALLVYSIIKNKTKKS